MPLLLRDNRGRSIWAKDEPWIGTPSRWSSCGEERKPTASITIPIVLEKKNKKKQKQKNSKNRFLV
jgi:hypothetical protein